mgnify:CR=1 FL=1
MKIEIVYKDEKLTNQKLWSCDDCYVQDGILVIIQKGRKICIPLNNIQNYVIDG